jgi:hypothetical protein
LRITPEISTVSIVLIGSFNPRIFQPEWFVRNGIIRQEDADSASIEVIVPQYTAFSVDWFNTKISVDRFEIESNSPPFIRTRDLTVRTFKEFLIHTPITKIGVNRIVHFNVASFEARDKIGSLLAPKAPWGEWAEDLLGTQGTWETVGCLRSITMMQKERKDGYLGTISARVEPSVYPNLLDRGIFMEVNDHYDLGDPKTIVGSDLAMSVLETQWERSLERSEWIIDQIMALPGRG